MGCDSQFKDSVKLFIEQIDVIKRLAAAYPDDLTFVTDAKGITAFHNSISYICIIDHLYSFFYFQNDDCKMAYVKGLEKAIVDKKLGSMIGVESGHAIGSSIAVLRTIYELGGRYMTLTHSCNTPW